MRKKQICRKQATALLAAVCITGGPVCTPMYVYAGERAANTENGTEIAQQIGGGVPDGIAGRKNTIASTVSGPAIQAPEENGAGGGETPGTDAASNGEYTDEAGVVYKYRIDGSTVDIYEVSGYDGKDVQIPSKIEGSPVAKLTMSMGFASIRSLTIPETVVSIKDSAFQSTKIGSLFYNAIDASGQAEPFYGAQIASLSIGEGVRAIPAGMFGHAMFQQETVVLDVPEIREGAFASASFKGLTVGEHVASIGKRTFAYSSLEKLNYNAASASVTGTSSPSDTMFQKAEIGGLQIGPGVKGLPYGFLCDVKLSLDVLTIPDSVESIGDYAFFSSAGDGDISIGTLTIGKNAAQLGDYIFGGCSIGQCFLNLLHAPNGMTSYMDNKPQCGSVESHNIGIYFDYFTANTDKENITVLCRDFDTSYSGEYFDTDKGCFAKRKTVICMECGHKESSVEYSDAVTVVFQDYDGTELSRQTLHPGEDAEEPADTPKREGWGFTGWDKGFTGVTEDLTVTAQYKINEYQITFYDADGKVIHTQTVKHGGKADCPQAPEKAADANHTYIFKGWDKDTENITGDTDFYPVYEAVDAAANAYTVTFMDGETILDVQKVEAGKDARTPKEPARPDEAWGKWKFTGWEGNYKNVTRDEIVQAIFEKVLKEYQVIFYDADGKILSKQTVKHGGKARKPQAPEKAADKGHTYVFKGWDGDTENITGDTSFRPVYETKALASANTFTVIFVDGDTVLDVQEVKRGSDAKAPENPSRPDEAWGRWRFTGWEGSYQNIMKDEVIHACFEEIRKEYKVVFYDVDGDILCTQTVKHGNNAEAPSGPKKEADEKYTYVFQRWDGSLENITKDTVFRPVYESRIRKYKVVFLNGEKVLGNQKIAYGDSAIAPPDPVKRDNGKYSYTFDRWDTDFNFIKEDTTVHAIFTRKEKNSTELKDGKDDGTGVKKEDKNQTSKENNTDKTSGSKGNNTDKPNGSKGGSAGKDHNQNGSSINQDKAQKENNLQNTGNSTGNHAGSSKNNKSSSGNSAGNPGNGLTNFGKNAGGTGSSTVDTGKKAGDSTINTGSTGSRADSSENGKSGADTSAVSSRTGKDKDKSSTDARMNRGNKTTGNKDVKGKEKNETGYKKEPRLQPQQLPMPITIQPKELPEGQKSGEAAQKDTGKNDGEATKKTEDNRQQKKINNMEHARWLFLFPGVAAAGFLCIWLYRNIFQKKKISGMICRESGEGVHDIEVKLENGSIHKINTNSSGQFCFDVPGKCNCRLSASIDGHIIFSLDIHMDEKEGEDVFCIRKSHCSHIQPRKEKGRYVVDVTV